MNNKEIWQADLDPTVGAEMKKSRPVLLIQNDSLNGLPLRIAVPFTGWHSKYERYPWLVKVEPDDLNGLDKPSGIDCFQIRTLSCERLLKKKGKLSRRDFKKVQTALKLVMSL